MKDIIKRNIKVEKVINLNNFENIVNINFSFEKLFLSLEINKDLISINKNTKFDLLIKNFDKNLGYNEIDEYMDKNYKYIIYGIRNNIINNNNIYYSFGGLNMKITGDKLNIFDKFILLHINTLK